MYVDFKSSFLCTELREACINSSIEVLYSNCHLELLSHCVNFQARSLLIMDTIFLCNIFFGKIAFWSVCTSQAIVKMSVPYNNSFTYWNLQNDLLYILNNKQPSIIIF
jgi:hypothetical protein